MSIYGNFPVTTTCTSLIMTTYHSTFTSITNPSLTTLPSFVVTPPTTSMELTTEERVKVTTELKKEVTTETSIAVTTERNISVASSHSLEYDYHFTTRICLLAGQEI